MSKTLVEFVNLKQARADALTAAARLAAWHWREGRRVLIAATDQAQAEALDRELWTFDEASFVPHAASGGPDQADEPVLIAPGHQNLNQAQVLVLMRLVEPLPSGWPHIVVLLPVEEGPELVACRDLYRRGREDTSLELAHTTSLP